MKLVTIKNIELAESLREKGYGTINGVLKPKDINELSSFFYDQLEFCGVDTPFFTTHWSSSEEYRRKVDATVRRVVVPAIDNWFGDYKCLLGYYLLKRPSTNGVVTPHRDWSLTDESKSAGLILWIPLTNISAENGGLEVVQNSHNNAPLRGTNIHPEVPTEISRKKLYPAAGDAIVMDNRLLHCSEPNSSMHERLVVGLILLPKDAEVLHSYRKEGERETRTVKTGDDFLLRYHFNHDNPTDCAHLEHYSTNSTENSLFGKGKGKNQVFRDIALNKTFEKYGYVVLKRFLDEETILRLRQVYEENIDVVTDKAFYISQWSNKQDKKERINKAVQSALVARAQNYLNGYEPVFAVFGVKHPQQDSEMYLHQDWAHVDETYYRTVNVWCPLLDISKDRGPVHVINGSHRLFDTWRGVDIPDSFQEIGVDELKKYLTDILMEAGDVIMWDHRIIHGSGVNHSDVTRVAAIVNMKPTAAKFYLFYADSIENPKKIEVFEPSEDFFVSNDSANEPGLVKEKAIFIHQFPYCKPQVTEAVLQRFMLDEFPN
ncbi:MAG: phytanoyl-CoA dioxygenase family protein [Flavobacteriales bacterium]|nr:phytanoyl-CoA dioxygenase family protein [Flavobacteriales bacterium]